MKVLSLSVRAVSMDSWWQVRQKVQHAYSDTCAQCAVCNSKAFCCMNPIFRPTFFSSLKGSSSSSFMTAIFFILDLTIVISISQHSMAKFETCISRQACSSLHSATAHIHVRSNRPNMSSYLTRTRHDNSTE